MLDWKVGDKVVCLNANWGNPTTNPSPLMEGRIYTIRSIGPYQKYCDPALAHTLTDPGAVGVELEEAPICHNGLRYVFFHTRFRKTIDKKATTEFFERLCLDACRKATEVLSLKETVR